MKKTIKKNIKNPTYIPIKCEIDYDNEIFNSPIQFTNYDPYDIIQDEYIEYVKKNILETFIDEFKDFKYKYNIESITPYMSIQGWININNYIFRYIYTLSQTNSIEKMIFEVGYSNYLLKLINFYKYNIPSMASKIDCEIIKFIYSQPISEIYADMSLVILREAIGFIPLNKLIKMQ